RSGVGGVQEHRQTSGQGGQSPGDSPERRGAQEIATGAAGAGESGSQIASLSHFVSLATSSAVIRRLGLSSLTLSQLITAGAYGNLPFFTNASMCWSRRSRSLTLAKPLSRRDCA